MEELEDRLKELKNSVQLQQRKNQELEELRSSLHHELSIYKSVSAPRTPPIQAAVEVLWKLQSLCHAAVSWKVLHRVETGAAFQGTGTAT